MELRVLSYFLEVASQGSINKAADAIHITQPTLSRQLKKLEEELEVVLFVRGSKRIVLTDEGLLLKRRAEEMLALDARTKKELLADETSVEGTVVIGCGELDAVLTLSKLCASFAQRYPMVSFEFITGTADHITDLMEHGLCDVGILLEPVNVEKYDFIRMKNKETYSVLMRQDDKLAKKSVISPKDLSGRVIGLPGRRGVKNEVEHWLGDALDSVSVRFSFDLSTNAAIMVESGLGIAIVVTGSIPYLDNDILVMRPLKPKLMSQAIAVWKKGQPGSLAVAKFVRFVSAG